MNSRILERHLPELPTGWTLEPIHLALQEVDRPITMRDDETYRLVSVRRRNGGLFFRTPLKGAEILTKTLRHIVPGSFIVARMQAVHGATTFVRNQFAGAAISKSYSSFVGTSLCSAEYFSWLATHPLMYEYLMDSSHGVVIEKMTLDQNRWMSLKVPLPPSREQQRIVEILNAVEDQIRNSDALTEKLRSIQQGLIADLIEPIAVGQAAGNPKVESLDDNVTWLSGGTPAKSVAANWGGEIPWLTPRDMKSRIVARTTHTLTPEGAGRGSRLAPENSVYIVVRGMILAHTFPVARLGRPGAFNQDVKAVVPRKGLDPDYLSYWFSSNSDYFLRLVGEATHGTKKLDLPDLKEVPVNFPDWREQRRVVAVLEAHERQIEAEAARAAKLRAQRTGLAADLLVGRVRVPPKGLS